MSNDVRPYSRVSDVERLRALERLNILDTPPEPEFDGIVQLARRVCSVPVALISLVASDRQWFKARAGLDASETPINQSVCAYALEEDELLVIPDLSKDPRTKDNPLVSSGPQIRFYAGAVLRSFEGQPLGALCVIDGRPRPEGLTADQADSLRLLAQQTSSLFDLRRAVLRGSTELREQKNENRASLLRALASEAASDQLRIDELRLRSAQEAGQVGSFEIDIASNNCVVSAEFCRIFGLSPLSELSADQIGALIDPEDRHLSSEPATRQNASAPLDTEYRIRRANDGTVRWIARRAEFVKDSEGRPTRMIGIVRDVTERKLVQLQQLALIVLGDALRDAETTADAGAAAALCLGDTLQGSRAGYALIDTRAERFVVERDWTSSGVASIVGRHATTSWSATIGLLVKGKEIISADVQSSDELMADARSYEAINARAELAIPMMRHQQLDGVLFVHSEVPRIWAPFEVSFARAVADRTYAAIAKIQAEADQRILNEELAHRLKNTLAMVQAIASQTLRGAADRDAVQTLTNRIAAMSKAHDVLLKQRWVGARIRAVIDATLESHSGPQQLYTDGPDLNLNARTALRLSLLLHELATNAVKYGALSRDGGRVDLKWGIMGTGAAAELALRWQESGGPTTREPVKLGLGSRLIKSGLSGTGDGVSSYLETGLVADFRVPLAEIENK